MQCTAKYISFTSLPLTFSFAISVTAVVAKPRSTLASHLKTTTFSNDDMITIRTLLPAFFGGQFLHFFCLFVLSAKLARMCF